MRNISKVGAVIVLVWHGGVIANVGIAAEPEPFTAVCSETSAQTFRESADSVGGERRVGWTADGTVGASQWEFEYVGGDTLRVDGKDVELATRTSKFLLAVSSGDSDSGTNAWSYAVHVEMKRIVAGTVGVYSDALGDGIFTSAVELTCTFS